MISVALFNNKGGVGKTTLTYHLAHMLQRLGHRVLAIDLDPQSNLTAAFLDEDELAEIWQEGLQASWPLIDGQQKLLLRADRDSGTVASAVEPIMRGLGDVRFANPITITEGLWLVPGDLNLSAFEDKLSAAWPNSLIGDHAALRTTTAFHRLILDASERVRADVVLVDVGPNLGAINRAALLAADTVLMPLAADLFSLRGLRNLGPALRDWRRIWKTNVLPHVPSDIAAPQGTMTPLGYVVMQPKMRLDRPVKAYQRWLDRVPIVFGSSVLDPPNEDIGNSYEIATLRNYQSLMPLAHDARKPMFDLRSADGALGSSQTLVQRCYQDFRSLSQELLKRLADLRAGD
ncbi:ParA family protein [Micromonospora sp. NPDC050200]|uniref:ParA family protein n=1 Tax=Micromonospora sp. NPDC050200 TaxID=3155664 RepID=UPI0034110C4F